MRDYTYISLDLGQDLDSWGVAEERPTGSRPKVTLIRSTGGEFFVFKRPKDRREHQIWSELLGSYIAGDLLGRDVQNVGKLLVAGAADIDLVDARWPRPVAKFLCIGLERCFPGGSARQSSLQCIVSATRRTVSASTSSGNAEIWPGTVPTFDSVLRMSEPGANAATTAVRASKTEVADELSTTQTTGTVTVGSLTTGRDRLLEAARRRMEGTDNIRVEMHSKGRPAALA